MYHRSIISLRKDFLLTKDATFYPSFYREHVSQGAELREDARQRVALAAGDGGDDDLVGDLRARVHNVGDEEPAQQRHGQEGQRRRACLERDFKYV